MLRKRLLTAIVALAGASVSLAACGASSSAVAHHQTNHAKGLAFSITVSHAQYQMIASMINNPKDGGLYFSVGDFIWSRTCGAPSQTYGAPINVSAPAPRIDRLTVALGPSLASQFERALRTGSCGTRSIKRDFLNATASRRLASDVASEESNWVPQLGYTLASVEGTFAQGGVSIAWHAGQPTKYGHNELGFVNLCNLQIVGPPDDIAAVEVTCVFSNTESTAAATQQIRFLSEPLILILSGNTRGWITKELHRTGTMLASGSSGSFSASYSDGTSVAAYKWLGSIDTAGVYITPVGYSP